MPGAHVMEPGQRATTYCPHDRQSTTSPANELRLRENNSKIVFGAESKYKVAAFDLHGGSDSDWAGGTMRRVFRDSLSCFPRRCCKVIIATAVLHNYLKQHCCPDPPMEDYNEADVAVAEAANGQRGLAHRAAFTLQHFS
ncbi:nuclease HARBI1 [Labeo rohita]|uniref:Nuclease HARBI1 n=1 Tax=Labeo rohita TaxID=84645 RepID=A0A498NR36_LABRO|nr:nuclease HARBI1 [Labeo rohita]